MNATMLNTNTRWGSEHVDTEACVDRAAKLAPDQEDMFQPFLVEMIKTSDLLLNIPAGFISHQFSPTFASAYPYTRAARWHSKRSKGHTEALNFNALLGADSGPGKTQAMRDVLGSFHQYEVTFKRDLVARNVTIESLDRVAGDEDAHQLAARAASHQARRRARGLCDDDDECVRECVVE